MQDIKLGINDQGIDTLVRDLTAKSDLAGQKISRIQTIYAKMSDYCNGAKLVSDDFLDNLTKVRENIEANVSIYISDLRTLQTRLNENDQYISTLFNEASTEQTVKNNFFENKDLIGNNKKEKDN